LFNGAKLVILLSIMQLVVTKLVDAVPMTVA
jgi:hypothetical protein